MKDKNSNMENRRAKQPKTKGNWIWEGDVTHHVRKLISRKKEQPEKKGQKRLSIWAKKQNNKVISQGVDECKRKTRSLQREKQTQQKTRNRKWLWKNFGGKQRAKNLFYIAGHSCCVSQIIRPVLKKHQNCRKNDVNCHNLKAKHQTQETQTKTKKKEQHKKTHKNNENINNRKTRRSQMKGIWVSKGDVREICWNDSSQNEGRYEQQTKEKCFFTPECCLKRASWNNNKQNNTHMVLKMEGKRKPKRTRPRASEGFWRKRFQGKATATN